MMRCYIIYFFFFSSRRRHTRLQGDWSSDVCSSDLFDLSGPVFIFASVHQAAGLEIRKALERLFFEDGNLRLYEFGDRKSTRLNSSHLVISYAVFCLKKKKHARDHHASASLHITLAA